MISIETFGAVDARIESHHRLQSAIYGWSAGTHFSLASEYHALSKSDGQPLAFASTTFPANIENDRNKTGFVGHFEALRSDVGKEMLEHCRRYLRNLGAGRIVGPINTSTWGPYRFARAVPGDYGDFKPVPFLSEPVSQDFYEAIFETSGFRICSSYESRFTETTAEYAKASLLPERIARVPLTFSHLQMKDFDRVLKDLYQLSLEGFRENAFFSPISWIDFDAMYQRMKPMIDPSLVLLAYDESQRMQGFMFAFMDPFSKAVHQSSVIFKTILTSKEYRGTGLGPYLCERIRAVALSKGARFTIHALMHDSNTSLHLSKEYSGRCFRKYVLYEGQT